MTHYARRLMLAAAALALLIPAAAAAQSTVDQATRFTFSQPVSIPGHTLPAGQYEFRIADTSNRHLIQVFDAKGTKLIATIFAVPAIRLDMPDKTEIRLMETPPDMAPAIQSYWYPGVTTGQEFIYPRDQADKLAKAGNTVLTEGPNGQVTRISSTGTETTYDPNDRTPRQVSGTTMATDTTTTATPPPPPPPPVTSTPQPATPPDTTTPRNTLPHTASSTPLVLLTGMLALALAMGSFLLRRRSGVDA